jgi:hypothetical protein
MRYLPSQVVFVLNRVQRRLTAARPGSVLILVVVLVVLLALMGTALLSTTRGDRYVAAQNTANTQIDLLVDGVVQMVKSAIADDLYGTVNNNRVYRPAWDSGTVATSQRYIDAYNHWDMPNIRPDDKAATPPYVAADHPQDTWLAPRLPSVPEPVGDFPNIMYWLSISMLPGVTHFDAPFACNPGTVNFQTINPGLSSTYTTRITSQTVRLTPNFVRPRGYAQAFPAWFLPTLSTASATTGGFVLAGDADGDGIADSGYVKIPVGELDGLTYYYAVRVIDNSSAVNVNTAWSRSYDLETPITTGTFSSANLRDGFGNPWNASSNTNNLGAFRSHVGLYELMHFDPKNTTGGTLQLQADYEIGLLNASRFNNSGGTTGFADSAAVAKEGTNATPRTDFTYVTQGDFLEHTLARRLDNVGTRVNSSNALVPMKPFGVSDTASLAYHYLLSSLDVSGGVESRFEQSNTLTPASGVPDSVHRGASNFGSVNNNSPVKNRRVYPASAIGDWLYDNFNWSHWTATEASWQNVDIKFAQSGRNSQPDYYSSLRPILTTHNPVSNLTPTRDPTIPAVTPAMPDYGPKYAVTPPAKRRLGTKTNINTAKFEELWRAFWCVMAESNGDSPFTAANGATEAGQGMEFNQSDFTPLAALNPQRMFRSSIRDPLGSVNRQIIPSRDMVQLRAAAAAVQAMQMRQLPDATKGKAPYSTPTNIRTQNGYDLRMFGTTPQPFITEVFAWYDAKSKDSSDHVNRAPYVAIELFNPFDYDIDISNLKIKYWHREAGVPTKTLMDTGITFSSYALKSKQFIIIDNYGGGENDDVQYYPPSSKLANGLPGGLTQGDGYYSRAGQLDAVLDNEMIITRTRTGEAEEQPVDSFDFSGFPNKDTGDTTQACAWHYVRRTSGGTQGDGRWACVYPGRYDLSATKGFDPTTPRQQGTEYVKWDAGTTDPWDGAGPAKAKVTLGADNPDANLPAEHEFVIPLPDRGSPGPNGLDGTARKFPFGMFARNGDILQVPFIASYVVRQGGAIREMNSISMDAAFAEDSDVNDDVPSAVGGMREQIGHFCPIAMTSSASSSSGTVDDFNDDQTADTIALQRYAWARKLFDYLTVQSPASDYSPDVSPDLYTAAGGTRPEPVKNTGDTSSNAAEEDGLLNSTGDLNANPPGSEDAVPTQGLININTAPWIVLSALPWVPSGQDKFKFDPGTGHFLASGNQLDDNIDIARAIAYWRDGEPAQTINTAKGPFRSAFDLYKVVDTAGTRVFQLIQNTMFGTTTEPGLADGEIASQTPSNQTGKDQVRDDFKEQYLLMTKVSNLITTRSDSFTVYILVQGWRGVGGNHPELVVQRRVAFIQDRSPITSVNTVLPSSVNVPTD